MTVRSSMAYSVGYIYLYIAITQKKQMFQNFKSYYNI
jgi:hypothetical protein